MLFVKEFKAHDQTIINLDTSLLMLKTLHGSPKSCSTQFLIIFLIAIEFQNAVKYTFRMYIFEIAFFVSNSQMCVHILAVPVRLCEIILSVCEYNIYYSKSCDSSSNLGSRFLISGLQKAFNQGLFKKCGILSVASEKLHGPFGITLTIFYSQ